MRTIPRTWSGCWSPQKTPGTPTEWPPYTSPQAVLDAGEGRLLQGREAIRKFFRELVATGCKFEMGEQQAALVSGDLALTSTWCRNGTLTAEVARRQSDTTSGVLLSLEHAS